MQKFSANRKLLFWIFLLLLSDKAVCKNFAADEKNLIPSQLTPVVDGVHNGMQKCFPNTSDELKGQIMQVLEEETTKTKTDTVVKSSKGCPKIETLKCKDGSSECRFTAIPLNNYAVLLGSRKSFNISCKGEYEGVLRFITLIDCVLISIVYMVAGITIGIIIIRRTPPVENK